MDSADSARTGNFIQYITVILVMTCVFLVFDEQDSKPVSKNTLVSKAPRSAVFRAVRKVTSPVFKESFLLDELLASGRLSEHAQERLNSLNTLLHTHDLTLEVSLRGGVSELAVAYEKLREFPFPTEAIRFELTPTSGGLEAIVLTVNRPERGRLLRGRV